jgi:glycosyltransferase involved in cell wall biosynthesis
MPTVSVIIPTYNRAHCIADAIDSVLAQSYHDFELIVVDDGSTDNTCEVVTFYNDRLKYIKQLNNGVSAARNNGINAAQGEWIAFLDSDDTWEPDKLKLQVDDIRLHPKAAAHMVDANITDPQGKEHSIYEIRGMKTEFERQPFRTRPLIDVLKAPFCTPCWMIQKKIIEKAGYFNPNMKIYEDYDLLTRVALEGPFLVNSYVGVHIRRCKETTGALSQLYQESRMQALNNLVHTYSNLKSDTRLASIEYNKVRRALSGVRYDLAIQFKKQLAWHSALSQLFKSFADAPGLRSGARALLAVIGAESIVNYLPGRQMRKSFRRSEMNNSL